MAEIKDVKRTLDHLEKSYRAERQAVIDGLSRAQRERLGLGHKEVDGLMSFQANGHKYTVNTSLAVDPYIVFEMLQTRIQYGMTASDLADNLGRAYQAMNSGKLADAAVIVHNMLDGMNERVKSGAPVALDICCLFIAREGEDRTKYDAELNERKKEDWAAEGIDTASLFGLASMLVEAYNPSLAEISRITSPNQPPKKMKPKN